MDVPSHVREADDGCSGAGGEAGEGVSLGVLAVHLMLANVVQLLDPRLVRGPV